MTIEAGQAAPDAMFDQTDGSEGRIAQFRGAPLVLYFYPKDDTSGCTREAQDFTALMPEFAALGVRVVGASKDSVASHAKFANKYDLAVQLVSDGDGSLCEAFGCWVEKSMYGKKYMGIERSTFLIDRDGKLAQVWRKVKVPGHADAVLNAVKTLG